MRRLRGGQMMLLGDVLRAAFERASTTVFGDRVALYLVALKDEAGFALALAIHAKVPGPDPAILRERSQERGVREPLMVGAAPVEVLARVVEELGGGGGDGGGQAGGGDRAGRGGGRGEPGGGRGHRAGGEGGPSGGRRRGRMLGWTIRELHRAGEIPVLVITGGVEVVSTLEALAEGEEAELLEEAAEVRGEGMDVHGAAGSVELAGVGKDGPRNAGGGGVLVGDTGPKNAGPVPVLTDDNEPEIHGWVVSPPGEA